MMTLPRAMSLFATGVLFMSAQAQYSGPESVEYDPVGDRYFVSNTSSGAIKVRDQAGVVTDFATVSPAPYGLEIMGDTLFACSGGSVKGYRLSDGAQVFNRNLGGSFCNGITTDGQYLYVTDFPTAAQRIYKVDVANNSHTTLVTNTGGQPNGIVWDPIGDRLVVVFWGSNAPIKAFDRNTGAATTLVANTGLGSIDGVTIDCLGNFLVASWSPDRITRYEPTFTAAGTDLGVPGLNNPADIDFDHVNNRVCIPNSGSNTVVLHELDCSTALAELRRAALLRAVPNPTQGQLRIEPELLTDEPYLLLDTKGLLVGGGTLRARSLLDISQLPAGVYTIFLTRSGHRLQVVRE
ncbi:MAG: SMP-30/gluconolactonase/LRE family protein [Flavobacteriales bacterium]|nr:SMP-30/gluconolactonase/LRE family protein [Flavobacteriales bacterium]